MLHSLDSIESTTIWILRYFSIAVLLLWPFFFVFRCEMDWKTTNVRKGDWDWIRNGRTPRFFVRLQATNESGHLSLRRRDHAPVFVPRSCADHSWQLGGRIHTTRFNLQEYKEYKDVITLGIHRFTKRTKEHLHPKSSTFFWSNVCMLQYSPLLACFVWNLQNFRSRSQQTQQLKHNKANSTIVLPSIFTKAPCAAGGPGDGAARAQPHLAPGDFGAPQNVSKPPGFFVTITENH